MQMVEEPRTAVVAERDDRPVYIYALVDPETSEARYVGQSVDPHLRWRMHQMPSCMAKKTRKDNWIAKLHRQGSAPLLAVLDQTDREHADEVENDWILFYRSINGTRQLNIVIGGAQKIGPMTGKKASAETRRRMSEALKKRCADPAYRERMRVRALRNGYRPPIHKGANNNEFKLTDEDVRAIREMDADGIAPVALAKAFGVTSARIHQLVTGNDRLEAGGPIRSSKPRSRLTDEQVRLIRFQYSQGCKRLDIAAEFGVTPCYVYELISGRKRRSSGLLQEVKSK